MIPIFEEDGKTRVPHTYNGLTLNLQIDHKNIIEVNSVRQQTGYSALAERRSFIDGMEVFPAFKTQKRLIVSGMVRASSKGLLHDRLEELASAFDPSMVSRDNPDELGFLPYDFDVPTNDTVTYPTGVIPCRYYVRAESAVEPPLTQYYGLSVPFFISLMAADPRRYTQATESLTGAGIADNSKASYWSWPTLTVAMAGAGSATFSINNSTAGTTPLVLDLSGLANGDAVVVDMLNRKITVNGTDATDRQVSGDFFWMEPGSNTIAVTNDTNASPTLTWRPAFSF